MPLTWRPGGLAWILLVLVLVLGPVCCLPSQSENSANDPEFQKGMAFPTWDADMYGRAVSDESLRVLADTTCTEWVQLVPTWYQNDRLSNKIFPDYEGQTARIETLKHAIQTAHALGLKVMLKPHVDSLSGEWRGTFQPEDPEIWFDNYRDMMAIFAKIARDEAVEILSVGCEFVDLTTEEYLPNWRGLVQSVRRIYTGPLIYAANWGREALQVEFWNDLDYVGIDAYFELTNTVDPVIEELLIAWTPYLAQIESIHEAWQRPIILTEIGYRSIDGANMRPWDWENPGELDLAEQALCYQAVMRAFGEMAWFNGIYWWNWEPDLSLGGMADKGYTPYGKPAGLVLKQWYCEETIGKKGPSRR
ncbi:MAG: hypothetical protein PVH84_09185 [Candidatus Aminicenantes bacterium]